MNSPKLTVIMAVFNSAGTIAKAVESVLSQDYENREIIVIDGGSSDGTIEILERYSNELDCLISEPDEGIYPALNRGICQATGDYVGFVHADDWLARGALGKIVDRAVLTQADVIFSNVAYHYQDGAVRNYRSNIDNLNKGMSVAHPTCYINTELIRTQLFDTRFKVSADFDQLFRLVRRAHASWSHIDEVLYNMRVGGLSYRRQNVALFENAQIQLREREITGLFYTMKQLVSTNVQRLLFQGRTAE